MFQIKICGITRIDDALAAADAGADAIGLNFFAESKRYVDPAVAREIGAALPAAVAKVGVFVNATVAEICRIDDQVGLDWIQLHGNEPFEFLTELAASRWASRPVLKALRIGGADLSVMTDWLAQCHQQNRLPQAVLIDAGVSQQFGGTGKTVDWEALSRERERLREMPLVLAGGLTPDNVAAAIRAVRPDGVDTASGVERSPGIKSQRLIQAFVRAARLAFASAIE